MGDGWIKEDGRRAAAFARNAGAGGVAGLEVTTAPRREGWIIQLEERCQRKECRRADDES